MKAKEANDEAELPLQYKTGIDLRFNRERYAEAMKSCTIYQNGLQ